MKLKCSECGEVLECKRYVDIAEHWADIHPEAWATVREVVKSTRSIQEGQQAMAIMYQRVDLSS